MYCDSLRDSLFYIVCVELICSWYVIRVLYYMYGHDRHHKWYATIQNHQTTKENFSDTILSVWFRLSSIILNTWFVRYHYWLERFVSSDDVPNFALKIISGFFASLNVCSC